MLKTTVLIILDGWGYRPQTEHNAIAAAYTPTWDHCWQHCPHTLLSAASEHVGLPPNQMGNSEVGHLHMGAGRLVPQTLVRINQAIQSGDFFNHPILTEAICYAKQQQVPIHVIGLLSKGGIHSHLDHIKAVFDFITTQEVPDAYLHAILDGRDTPPRSALSAISDYQTSRSATLGKIVSVIGRYYAMDRDKRWERTQSAYNLWTSGQATYYADTAEAAIEQGYQRGETDEFIQPTIIGKPNQAITIKDHAVLLVMNFRADRARQISGAFTQQDFQGFKRTDTPNLGRYITLTCYEKDLPAQVLFPPPVILNTVGEWIAQHRLKQLRIAETEKYAHVTFFFNGGRETLLPGEDRHLIASPSVATYDLCPEMHAPKLTQQLTQAIYQGNYDAIICNYANADMLGHTGNFKATVKAITTLDSCLQQVLEALKQVKGQALITADHGNAEYLYDPNTQQAHTAHTQSLVPCVYVGPRSIQSVKKAGSLIDIGPTFLNLMGLKPPPDMTGSILFR